jgi:hypothetical protein
LSGVAGPLFARIPLFLLAFRWHVGSCSDRIEHMRVGLVEHEARIDALLEVQARKAALAAEEQWLLHQIATSAPAAALPGCADKQWVREELAAALRIAPCTAASRLATAEQLVTELPATLAAVEAGLISFPHALRLCEATSGGMPADTVAQVEAYALARAEDATVAQFKATIARAVARFDRRDKTTQHEEAVGAAGRVHPARRRHHRPARVRAAQRRCRGDAGSDPPPRRALARAG